LAALTSLGAEPFTGDLEDKDAMASAFANASAAYLMVPPDLGNNDYRSYQDRIVETLASAVEVNKISHLVALSSFGADKPAGTGPIAGLHVLEERLKSISGLNTLALRAGYFMENTLPQAMIIQHMGVTAGPLAPELKIPMIASSDIGALAADELLRRDFTGFQIQELQGQRDLSMLEATAIIAKAIGKPDLKYHQLTYEQFGDALLQMGASRNIATLFIEMSQALNNGHVRQLEPRSDRSTTRTSYEEFIAEEFVPTFQRKSVA